jgi:Family of unknown function (DUF6452)
MTRSRIKTVSHWLPKAPAITVFLGIAFLLGIAACTQDRDPCLTPKIASFNLEMVHFPTDTATTTVDTALPHAVFGALSNKNYAVEIFPQQSVFTISLAETADTCRWTFTTDTASGTVHLTDTLTFFYSRQLQFLSNACGYTDFFKLDSLHTTNFNIDSIHITNTSITNDITPRHLKIYIHPDY